VAVAATVAVEVVVMASSLELQGDNPGELNTDSFPSPVAVAFCPLGLPINLSKGSHNCDLCVYCKRVGHREVVCMDKFMGKPKGQKAAVTGEGNESVLSSLGLSPCSSDDKSIATTSTATIAATASAFRSGPVWSGFLVPFLKNWDCDQSTVFYFSM
jgi:hypothetical protein